MDLVGGEPCEVPLAQADNSVATLRRFPVGLDVSRSILLSHEGYKNHHLGFWDENLNNSDIWTFPSQFLNAFCLCVGSGFIPDARTVSSTMKAKVLKLTCSLSLVSF